MNLVRKYWLASIVVAVGAVLTVVVGLRSGSTVGVIWSGATVGILTGIAVGAAQRGEPGRK